ncbi:hypothetical protein CRE_03920 [Caenorhabditis remanei]|uniref:NTF2-like domain-containing protein n=1 Tax=Caenorhabditis remanei TaxID=31234 RepID=E3LXU7_CAERE|nr:hypothetical protein CRE_03920 [Caenorhabditis remanei]
MWTTPLILLLLSFYGISSEVIPDDPGFIDHLFNEIIPPRAHFHGFLAQDNNREVVEKFLARVTRSIESKDASIIGGLFQPGFIFKGCKGTYNKQQVIGMISQIPAGTNFHFVLKTVEDDGDSIKYSVSVSGFGPSPLDAEFTLNKVDQQLHCGRIPACQKTHFHGLIAHDTIGNIPPRAHFHGNSFVGAQPEDPNSIMSKFIEQMRQVIDDRNATELAKLFDDNFRFQGCPEVYSKADVIEKFATIPSFLPVGLNLKTAVWNNQGQIIFTVTITVFSQPDTDYEFVFCPYRNVLKSGRRPSCESERSGERSPHLIIGRSSGGDPLSSDYIVQELLDGMKRTIRSRDPKKIGEYFDDSFTFKGCQGTYTKDDTVKKITSIPPEYNLEFKLKSSKFNSQGQIEYTVSVSLPSKDSIDAEFVYCHFKHVLKSGRISSCPARRFADFY